jgi:hypothetical protein
MYIATKMALKPARTLHTGICDKYAGFALDGFSPFFSPKSVAKRTKKQDILKSRVHHQGAITLWMIRCAHLVNSNVEFDERC